MAVILDYSDFIQAPQRPGSATSGSSYEALPGMFGHCPYCERRCKKQHYAVFRWYGDVYRCSRCGWWDSEVCEDALDEPYLVTAWSKDQYRAVLRTFSPVGSNAPVEALVKYLSAHPQTLYSIPARKLEEVAQAVLCEFYRCEVRHVGRTGDGGIDLLVINSDNPIAVQVKRRMKSGKAEGVQLIREFLGAIQLEGLKEAIIVSTADRFTTGAVGAAERAVQGKLVRNYRLIDFPSLIDLLNLKRGSVPKPLRVLGISDW